MRKTNEVAMNSTKTRCHLQFLFAMSAWIISIVPSAAVERDIFGYEVHIGVAAKNDLDWMGGYFETGWSVNPWWEPEFKAFSEHPTARGLKPFTLRDEWYYHMRFKDDMKDVTPGLSAVAPVATVSGEKSDRGGNADVFKAVSEGKPQHMAWAYDRPGGGRGFASTY